MTVMLGVGFGYPCSTYARGFCTFRASAEEEIETPTAQINNPSMADVNLLLAMTMQFLLRFLPAPGITMAPVAQQAACTTLGLTRDS